MIRRSIRKWDNSSTYGSAVLGSVLHFPNDTGARTVRNCTISGNTFAHADGYAVYGYCWGGSESVHLYNNIILSNTCTKAGATHPNCLNHASKKWYVKNNCWDYDDANKLQDPKGGSDTGTVNADPKFDAAKGAPWLSADSPCRNAGDDDYAPTGLDLFGHPRKVGRHVDIGAFEHQGFGLSVLLR